MPDLGYKGRPGKQHSMCAGAQDKAWPAGGNGSGTEWTQPSGGQ